MGGPFDDHQNMWLEDFLIADLAFIAAIPPPPPRPPLARAPDPHTEESDDAPCWTPFTSPIIL